MVTKLISSRAIIAKVIADNDLRDFELKISDMMEWCGEAIEKISGLHTYGKRVSGADEEFLKLCNYQAKLPCEVHNIDKVAYSFDAKHWIPMRYSTGAFNAWYSNCCSDETGRYYSDFLLAQILIQMSQNMITIVPDLPHTLTFQDAITYLNGNPNTRTVLTSLVQNGDTRIPNFDHRLSELDKSHDLQYTVKPGYINCNIKEGYLKLAYTAVPRDKEGYPMIPDNASVSEAVYWYITMKLLYPKYATGKIPQHVYMDARTSWHYYCNQAYGNLLMPNSDGIKSLQNAWLRLMPELEEHGNFDSTIGQEQMIYNQDTLDRFNNQYWKP